MACVWFLPGSFLKCALTGCRGVYKFIVCLCCFLKRVPEGSVFVWWRFEIILVANSHTEGPQILESDIPFTSS